MTHSDVLVVGSQSTASSGEYTRILMDYQADPSVALRAELLDRILGQAAVLEQQHYAKAVICLSALELEANLALLLGALSPSLAPHATLHIPRASRYVDLIKQAGFEIYSDSAELTIARKTPSTASTAPAPAQAKAVPLKLRPRNGARKASLWATQPAPSAPSIDESTLLTEADLQRRETIQEPGCDVKRTRKACKNCSCGLRELLLQEQDDLPNANKATQINAQGQAQEDKQVISTGGATSSCGSCYLGDAFRCASCPYLGLPAFEPGQKVSLGSFGDDI